MIVGIDAHKASLVACAVDQLGRQLAGAGFPNDPAGHQALLAWAAELAPEGRRFGLESSGHLAYALARTLLDAGEAVVEVPPGLVDIQRRRRPQGKSDAIDALAIARVTARGQGLVPVTHDPAARELELLSDYRRQLRAERTRTANACTPTWSSCARAIRGGCPT